MAAPVASSPLAWTTDGSGSSTRPLDALETFFKLIGDSGKALRREQFAISLALRLELPSRVVRLNPADHLARAWLLLRWQHPNLGAVAREVGELQYMMKVEPVEADQWLAQTFTVEEQAEDSNDLVPRLEPAATATCHWIPSSQELVLRSSHWRMDGNGMMLLAHSFLTTLSTVLRMGPDRDPDEYPGSVGGIGPLTPSLGAVSGSPVLEDDTPGYLKDGADAHISEFMRGMPSIGLPTRTGSEATTPTRPRRATLTLPPDQTAALVSACKARGLSVSSAVHAGLVRASAAFPQHPLATHYATQIPTDMRGYLPASWNGPEYAAGLFCAGLPVCIPDVQTKTFDEVAAQTAAVYARDLARVCARDDGAGEDVSMLELYNPLLRRILQLTITPPPPGLPPLQTAELSSFGVVERRLQREYVCGGGDDDGEERIRVRGFWMGVDMLSRSLQCHLWTFRDEMTIQGCYNASFYTEDFVLKVLETVKKELFDNLVG